LRCADKKSPGVGRGKETALEQDLPLLILVALSALLTRISLIGVLLTAALTGLLVLLARVLVGRLVRVLVLPVLAALLIVVRICHYKLSLVVGIIPLGQLTADDCVPARCYLRRDQKRGALRLVRLSV
jgi:hypothetical protein